MFSIISFNLSFFLLHSSHLQTLRVPFCYSKNDSIQLKWSKNFSTLFLFHLTSSSFQYLIQKNIFQNWVQFFFTLSKFFFFFFFPSSISFFLLQSFCLTFCDKSYCWRQVFVVTWRANCYNLKEHFFTKLAASGYVFFCILVGPVWVEKKTERLIINRHEERVRARVIRVKRGWAKGS